MNPDSPRLRLSILGVVAVSLFAALFARLWYLQVMANDEYQVAAESNRIREVPVEAPRGRILDRNKRIIVDNRISIQVTIDRSALGDLDDAERQRVLGELADALASSGQTAVGTVEALEARIEDPRFSPYVPVPVAGDVPDDLKIWIDEHRAELPSVAADRVAVRSYPFGRLAAHVIGYTGKITKEELADVPAALDAAKHYELNDSIGKYGIERTYEQYLRGRPGIRRIEVDAEGNPVRIVSERPPIPGDDILLNIDINVQGVAEQALQSGLERAARRPAVGSDRANTGAAGSTVVIDPLNGGVLAMASFPNFAPADFVDGISNAEWQYLDDERNHYPLNNWALQGQYAPGSTFKPFTAASALSAGLVQPGDTINDQGVYEIPNCKNEGCTRQNDGKRKFGTVDLRRSLTVSSDVYYYGLGAKFWINRDTLGGPEGFRELLERWGFYEDTGIDLPAERPGRIPSPAWKKEFCKDVQCVDDGWFTGDSVNMAIGQGDVLVTPLQLAAAYAALGNGGTRWVPQVAHAIIDGRDHESVKHTFEPARSGTIELAPEWRQAIVEGLVGVTTQEGGTAVGAFSGFNNAGFPIAAKTGTAQVNNKASTAAFGAFGPAFDPHYAIAVFMEESGYGGSAAAPVARRLFDVLSSSVPMPDAAAGLTVDPDALAPETGDVRD